MNISKHVNKNVKTFNLTRLLNNLVITGGQFYKEVVILPLYEEGNPISYPHDAPNSKDTIMVYYMPGLAGSNLRRKIRFQYNSIIVQLTHSVSSFKQYLLDERVHINNAQLGPVEAVVLGGSQDPILHLHFVTAYAKVLMS
jgi:hypothetical protein